mmetsp:Transcript_90579/g.230444  ORF Transcript_90579/g.230444 Transcript_90579/m.230444 type:complete len:213 (+) Transcript_90579:54-692(+)
MAEEDHYDEGPEYWNKRYLKEPKLADWVAKYDALREALSPFFVGNLDMRICHLGCGNSLLPEALYDEGYHDIVNVDISEVVIEQMRVRNAEQRPEMEWQVADCTSMSSFEDGRFDLMIDKALIDTLLCEDNVPDLLSAYFKEVERVMTADGLALFISFGPPDMMLKYFSPELTSLAVEVIEVRATSTKSATGLHFIYVGRRAQDAKALPQLG